MRASLSDTSGTDHRQRSTLGTAGHPPEQPSGLEAVAPPLIHHPEKGRPLLGPAMWDLPAEAEALLPQMQVLLGTEQDASASSKCSEVCPTRMMPAMQASQAFTGRESIQVLLRARERKALCSHYCQVGLMIVLSVPTKVQGSDATGFSGQCNAFVSCGAVFGSIAASSRIVCRMHGGRLQHLGVACGKARASRSSRLLGNSRSVGILLLLLLCLLELLMHGLRAHLHVLLLHPGRL